MSVETDAARMLTEWAFAGATETAMAELLALCPERFFAVGEVLVRERTFGDELFFLLDGEVAVRRADTAGVDHEVTRLRAPDLLGPLVLIDQSPRSATLAALTPVRVRTLDRRTWNRLSGAPTAAGSTLRRLLLSALHGQLAETHARFVAATQGPGATLAPDEDTSEFLKEIVVAPR